MVKRFEELPVWKASRELTKDVYTITREKAFTRDVRLASRRQAAPPTAEHSIVSERFLRPVAIIEDKNEQKRIIIPRLVVRQQM